MRAFEFIYKIPLGLLMVLVVTSVLIVGFMLRSILFVLYYLVEFVWWLLKITKSKNDANYAEFEKLRSETLAAFEVFLLF